MDGLIKQIEDMSLNAWPSHKMEMYDGWILRFSDFYTHRTNSVEQLSPSVLPWREKIPYCEEEYCRNGTPAVFKISPLVSPDFDYMLENRGYEIQHVTDVCTMRLSCPDMQEASQESSALSFGDVEYTDDIPDEWIESLFRLKGMTNPVHRRIVPSMYHSIPKRTIAACIRQEEGVVATGLGILDRDYIGIYAIHVSEAYRRQGMARRICTGLLHRGRLCGAENAYLQVVQNNKGAQELYHSLGFQKIYTYWFRVQPSSPGSAQSPG